jgi:CO/xanthine dehydrogenase FAD-binding subunit
VDRSAADPFAVVDLQALGLNQVKEQGNFTDLGATLTLQALSDAIQAWPGGHLDDLGKAVRHECSYHIRQVGTLAGTLMACDGRSPFATAMVALDAMLTLEPGKEQIGLGDVLPLRAERIRQRLITRITIPTNTRLVYDFVARSPADRPIVCVAAAAWPSGRTRVVVGGFGSSPVLAFDGSEPQGADIAAGGACSQAGDSWATAEYQREAAEILTRRSIESLSSLSKDAVVG